jgi:hypothetical protein
VKSCGIWGLGKKSGICVFPILSENHLGKVLQNLNYQTLLKSGGHKYEVPEMADRKTTEK